jgi:hypothetical protein
MTAISTCLHPWSAASLDSDSRNIFQESPISIYTGKYYLSNNMSDCQRERAIDLLRGWVIILRKL